MLYRNILSQSIKASWQYKYLWFFGLFAALLSNGGEYEIFSRGLGGGNNPSAGIIPWFQSINQTGIFSMKAVNNIINIAQNDPFSLVAVIIVGLVILALISFVVWLSMVSQAALVNNAAVHLRGGKEGDIKGGLANGIKKFWPVLSLNLLAKAAVGIVLVIFSLPMVHSDSKLNVVLDNLFYILIFIVFVFLVLALTFIVKYAIGFSVIQGKKIRESLMAGWQLFLKNWIVSMEMAIILFFVSFAASFAYLLAMLVFAIPFYILIFISVNINIIAFLFILFSALIFYVASLGLFGSILSTFQIFSWTGLFLELTGKSGAESKLVRVINGLLEKK